MPGYAEKHQFGDALTERLNGGARVRARVRRLENTANKIIKNINENKSNSIDQHLTGEIVLYRSILF